jgi:hypothetical protein
MTRVLGLLIAAFAVTALLWIAGEYHRANCFRYLQQRTCSALPWHHEKPIPAGRGLPTRLNVPTG